MPQSTETLNPEALNPMLQRAETQQLMAQSALLLAEINPVITEGDALLASSQEDANRQLQSAEQVAIDNATEKAKKETEIATKLKEVLSAPEVTKLGETLASVQEMRAKGIDDKAIAESLKRDGITLDISKTPKRQLKHIAGLTPDSNIRWGVTGNARNITPVAEEHVSVSIPGFSITERKIDTVVYSTTGGGNYSEDYRTAVSVTEHAVQTDDITASNTFNEGVTITDTQGNRVGLTGENANSVAAQMPHNYPGTRTQL